MKWFFILWVLSSSLSSPRLLELLASISQPLQRKCAHSLPENFEYRNLSQSFLCGTPLNDPFQEEVFRKTGLLHLMVVSGGHLQILSFFMIFLLNLFQRKRKFPLKLLLWLCLFFYCLVTGFQAPVVRAFCGRLVSELSRRFHWHWDGGKIQMFTGVFLLLLFPQWSLSLSFYLSWLAALGFLLTPLYQRQERFSSHSNWYDSLVHCYLIQAFMAVFFLHFSILGTLMNVLLAPLLGLLLFPISILPVFWAPAGPLTDPVWNFILAFLKQIGSHFGSPDSLDAFDISTPRWIFLWIFLAAIHCGFEMLRQHRYQRSHV